MEDNKKKILIAGGNEITNAKLKALLDKTGKVYKVIEGPFNDDEVRKVLDGMLND